MMRPRAAIAKARFAFGAVARNPFANALTVDLPALRSRTHRLTRYHRVYHPQSTCRGHWGILVSVHSVLLVGTDGVGTISFSQLDRGDNVLKLHT
jgi:hypothetical protein